MEIDGKVAVVTGGAGGIGGALAEALVAKEARVVVVDLDTEGAERMAATLGERALGLGADVGDEEALQGLLESAAREFGPVDLFFANAGIGPGVGLGFDDADWERSIDVNLMAHVRAARLLVPGWLERGSGYFVSTASAAGLLTQIGSAPYSVTKHGALALAEWLSVTYGDRGIGVSCICPMGVRTAMVESGLEATEGDARLAAETVAAAGELLAPAAVAEATLAAVEAERFLVLPHPEVLEYFRRKGTDYDRWLAGMRRLRRQVDN